LLEEAVCYAKEYEHVIFVGGLNHDYDVEGQDRLDMKLPYGQDEVIEAVLEANPNTVVVMVAGSPVEMGRWADKAKAIVWNWYAGMESGTALAEIILGEVNPSAKLPESFPYTHMDCSAHCVGEFGKEDVVHYGEGIYVGYRYYEKEKVPVQFCFGHGLSYTEYVYSNLTIQKQKADTECVVVVSCNVKNVGKCAGKEIVQLYIKDKNGVVDKPEKELKGYAKVELQPGESRRIRMQLSKKDFAYYEEKESSFKIVPGTYEIILAASVQDERLCGEVYMEDC
jgi:beta-glucosidase